MKWGENSRTHLHGCVSNCAASDALDPMYPCIAVFDPLLLIACRHCIVMVLGDSRWANEYVCVNLWACFRYVTMLKSKVPTYSEQEMTT